jgi:hypothetical protein
VKIKHVNFACGCLPMWQHSKIEKKNILNYEVLEKKLCSHHHCRSLAHKLPMPQFKFHTHVHVLQLNSLNLKLELPPNSKRGVYVQSFKLLNILSSPRLLWKVKEWFVYENHLLESFFLGALHLVQQFIICEGLWHHWLENHWSWNVKMWKKKLWLEDGKREALDNELNF